MAGASCRRFSLRTVNVHLSLRLLVLLIATSPVIIFVDDPLTWGLVAAITAVAIGIVAFSIPSAEAQFLSPLYRPLVIVVAIPAIWMVIQLIPIPSQSLSHPIWASAATALGTAQFGGMGIDPGATLITMTRYFCTIGVAFVTSVLTLDRRRAEQVLFSLVGAAGVTALMLLPYDVNGFVIFGVDYDPGHAAVMAAITVLGTIFAAAAVIRTLERYETRRSHRDMTRRQFWTGFVLWLAIWSISWFVISGRTASVFAAACGTGTLVIIQVIRRLGFDRRASAAVAATAVAVAIAVVATRPSGSENVTLRYAVAPPASVQMTQQMITDTRWTGAGPGAFSSLVPIYREINDPEAPAPPTTAAAIAIELGRPVLIFVLALTIVSAALLADGALRRGRDSFYSAAGAGCITALTIEMFTDATSLSTSVQIIAAAIVGLGLAQIKSPSRQ
jgi:hypothetical protein